MKRYLFSYFYTQPQPAELKVNLLADASENDEKSLIIDIKQDEREAIETKCAKLEKIIAKLELAHAQKSTKLKTQFALFNIGLSGLTAYGFSQLVKIAHDATLAKAQTIYDFSHVIMNNSTCAESTQQNIYYYCPPRAVSIDMVQGIMVQASALMQNTTNFCQQMQREYCELGDREGGTAFAAVLVGIASLVFLRTAVHYGYSRRTDPNFIPDWVRNHDRILTRDELINHDIRFLEDNAIHVNSTTPYWRTISDIRGKMTELRIKTEHYEPSLYNEIVHSYLSPQQEDKDAREFMRSFQ